RIVGRPAVPHAAIEIAVRPERQVPAVVIRERLRDARGTAGAAPSQVEPRRRVRDDGTGCAPESRDDRVAGTIGEVHEEPAAGRIRGKGETEQAALALLGRDA